MMQGALQFEVHYAGLQPFPSSVQFLAVLQSLVAVARSLRLELSACGLHIQVCTVHINMCCLFDIHEQRVNI